MGFVLTQAIAIVTLDGQDCHALFLCVLALVQTVMQEETVSITHLITHVHVTLVGQELTAHKGCVHLLIVESVQTMELVSPNLLSPHVVVHLDGLVLTVILWTRVFLLKKAIQ